MERNVHAYSFRLPRTRFFACLSKYAYKNPDIRRVGFDRPILPTPRTRKSMPVDTTKCECSDPMLGKATGHQVDIDSFIK